MLTINSQSKVKVCTPFSLNITLMIRLACQQALNDGNGKTIKLKSAVCSLYSPLVYSIHFTLSLHFTPGPWSAVCSLQFICFCVHLLKCKCEVKVIPLIIKGDEGVSLDCSVQTSACLNFCPAMFTFLINLITMASKICYAFKCLDLAAGQ